LNDSLKWRALCIADSSGIRDISGNIVNDTANFRYFIPALVNDTIAPSIIFNSVKDSSLSVALEEKFDFVFNIPMNDSSMNERISLIDLADSSSKAVNSIFIMHNILRISPEKKLENDRWYLLKLDLTECSSSSGLNMRDTIINIRFKTEDTRSYGSASGRVTFSEALTGDLYINFTAENLKKVYQTKADKDGYWKITGLPAGKYSIDIFLDENFNGKYDFGNAFPFKHSEKFKKYDTEINIKSRWDTDKINITFD
jgi:hypothetical protein